MIPGGQMQTEGFDQFNGQMKADRCDPNDGSHECIKDEHPEKMALEGGCPAAPQKRQKKHFASSLEKKPLFGLGGLAIRSRPYLAQRSKIRQDIVEFAWGKSAFVLRHHISVASEIEGIGAKDLLAKEGIIALPLRTIGHDRIFPIDALDRWADAIGSVGAMAKKAPMPLHQAISSFLLGRLRGRRRGPNGLSTRA